MRYRFFSPLTLSVAAVFVVAACNEQQPTAPSSSTATTAIPGTNTQSVAAANPVVLSVTGSAQATGPLVGTTAAGWRTFTVNAQQRQDGSVTGQVEYDQRAAYPGSVIEHGTVSCMKDLGDGVILIDAHGTKRIADADPAPPPFGLPSAVEPDNDGMLFAVRDNGEGANAAPDQFTATIHTLIPVADAVCANPGYFGFSAALAEAFFNNAEAGNIQVRP